MLCGWDLCLSETYALKYWWCSPPRTGIASVRPTVWTARGIGASLRSDRRFPAPIGSEPSAVPADHRLRLENFQCVQYSWSHTVEPRKHQRSMLPNVNRFGDLRRSTLSWCRRTRISASNLARDRNSPIKTHQINLQRSLIGSEYQPIRGRGQPFWVCGRDS
jgi:hypothetical protein